MSWNNVSSTLILQDWADTQLVYIEVLKLTAIKHTAISHWGMFCNWLELITCTILPKLIKIRIVVVVVCIGIFEMDICACMQTYILYINTKCASGVCALKMPMVLIDSQ